MKYLVGFDPTKKLYIDCETMSGKDDEKAFRPYHGHTIAGVAIGQKGVEPIYLPIRHRQQFMPGNELLPFDDVIAELKAFALRCVELCNINMKFDLHFLAQDGIDFPNAVIRELKVKARLVNNYLPNYKLETLAKTFCQHELKSSAVKEWCTENGTKDYGMVPVPLIAEYAKQDIRAAMALDDALETLLPAESREVYEYECRFQRILFRSERHGVLLNPDFFKKRQKYLLFRAIHTQAEIADIVTRNTAKDGVPGMDGNTFNPGSQQQLNQYFVIRGIEPIAFTEKMNPQWNKDVLIQIDDELPQKIIEYNNHTHHESTFCKGWLEAADSLLRMHPSFDSGGTATGRVSCRQPNMQNPPPWVWDGIVIPPGYVGVKFDASQIEYRIFAHYSRYEPLLAKYRENPKTDFHQIFADLLGIPRQFTKMLNFAILYGIGVRKLTKNIIRAIDKYDSAELRKNLRRYVATTASRRDCLPEDLVPEFDPVNKVPIDKDVLAIIAKAIIDEYHARTPAIKALIKELKDVIWQRGWIQNYFGRRYHFSPDKAYIALNYLCQGTAADIFKRGVVHIFEDPDVVASGAEMDTNIHDAVYAIVPIAWAQRYWDACQRHFGQIPTTKKCPEGFRVPILIDGEVAIGTWGNSIKIKNDDVMASLGMIAYERYSTAA